MRLRITAAVSDTTSFTRQGPVAKNMPTGTWSTVVTRVCGELVEWWHGEWLRF